MRARHIHAPPAERHGVPGWLFGDGKTSTLKGGRDSPDHQLHLAVLHRGTP
jgi:hypothetical protein